jgi:hypothetical protein
VREAEVRIGPSGQAPIRVTICAPAAAGTEDVLLFVNDSNGQTHEVLQITLHATAH